MIWNAAIRAGMVKIVNVRYGFRMDRYLVLETQGEDVHREDSVPHGSAEEAEQRILLSGLLLVVEHPQYGLQARYRHAALQH